MTDHLNQQFINHRIAPAPPGSATPPAAPATPMPGPGSARSGGRASEPHRRPRVKLVLVPLGTHLRAH